MNMALFEVNDGVVKVKLTSTYARRPLSTITLKEIVALKVSFEKRVSDYFPFGGFAPFSIQVISLVSTSGGGGGGCGLELSFSDIFEPFPAYKPYFNYSRLRRIVTPIINAPSNTKTKLI